MKKRKLWGGAVAAGGACTAVACFLPSASIEMLLPNGESVFSVSDDKATEPYALYHIPEGARDRAKNQTTTWRVSTSSYSPVTDFWWWNIHPTKSYELSISNAKASVAALSGSANGFRDDVHSLTIVGPVLGAAHTYPSLWNALPPIAVTRHNRSLCAKTIPMTTLLKESIPDPDNIENHFSFFFNAHPDFPITDTYPYDQDLRTFEARAFVLHGEDTLPVAGVPVPVQVQKGGIVTRTTALLKGSDLGNIFDFPLLDEIGAVRFQDIRAWIKASFLFELGANGIVKVVVGQSNVDYEATDSCGLTTPCVLDSWLGCVVPGLPYVAICPYSEINGGVMERIKEKAAQASADFAACQRVPIPNLQTGGSVTCNTVADCAGPKATLAGLVESASTHYKSMLPPVSGATVHYPSTQRGRIDAYAQSATALVNDNANWACSEVVKSCADITGSKATGDTKLCQFIPKPKRLAHYPDGLELVWADQPVGSETVEKLPVPPVTTTGEALYFALNALPRDFKLDPAGKPVRNMLCDPPPPANATPVARSYSFVTYSKL